MEKKTNIQEHITQPLSKRLKLKVCGMKHSENITAVAAVQPDYMGFIFYDKSPRHVSTSTPSLPLSIKKVGVFVNASVESVVDIVEEHQLSAIQLHGEESPEYCRQLRVAIQGHSELESQFIHIWKVFGIKATFDFARLQPYEGLVDYFLFDTKGKAKGGNGYTFDWSVLQGYPSTTPFILSGGIGLEEVPSILEFLNTPEAQLLHALDVNSKFEIEPGIKDTEELKQFKNKVSI